MKITTLIGVTVAIVIALVLGTRNLYIAIDDENYINYFLLDDPFASLNNGWWIYLLDEPLWRLYAWVTGSNFGPENALKFTLFLSSFMFMVSCGVITRGAWLLVFLLFIIDENLATQMYFNQMRQGFALSTFLSIVAIGFSPLIGAAAAAMIHSSFLMVIPCLLLSWGIRKLHIHWFIALAVTVASAFALYAVSPNIDLGRRSEYEMTAHRTLFHYLISVFQYVSVLFFLFKVKDFDKKELPGWLYLALIYYVFVTCLTSIHEVAGRLMNFENVFIMIALGLIFKRTQVKVVALLWLLLMVALQIKDYQKASYANNTNYDKWVMLLNKNDNFN